MNNENLPHGLLPYKVMLNQNVNSISLYSLLIVCTPLLSAKGLNLLPNFQKRGLDRRSTLIGGLLEKRG